MAYGGSVRELAYKEASRLLFIDREHKTHVFLSFIGANWDTAELRKVMRKSRLHFDEGARNGHQIRMDAPNGKVYWLETDDAKVKALGWGEVA